MIQRITANLVGAQTRRGTLDGKDYLVVPTIMLTEGVHHGSQGPLFYSKNQLAKNPLVWNHKPIVLYHPIDPSGGDAISACTPEVIERQGCGLLMNAGFDGRLKVESWLDEPKLRRLDSRVLDAIARGEMVEVSTGLWNDLNPIAGVWNGESYKGEVINIMPDHLALLPDQKGACSTADGAGLLRNESVSTGPNDLSFDDIREQVRSALRATYPSQDYIYVADVFRTYAVYEVGLKCYQIKYSIKSGKVTLSKDEPQEVRKVTSYMTANELLVGQGNNLVFSLSNPATAGKILGSEVQTAGTNNQETPMPTATPASTQVQNVTTPGQIIQESLAATAAAGAAANAPAGLDDARRSAIDQLIQLGTATEADRPQLQNMTDHEFKGVQAFALRRVNNITPASQAQAPMPVSVQQFLQTAPAEIAEMLQNALLRDEEEKQTLIATITANRNNRFSPEWLKLQKVAMLRGLVSLAAGQAPVSPLGNYSGQADVPMFLPTTAQMNQNAAPSPQQPVLTILPLFTETPAKAG